MTTIRHTTTDRHELETFLCDYAATLLECGATTVRIEKNVLRMAEAYGSETEVNIYPRHVEVVVKGEAAGSIIVRSKATCLCAVNYHTVKSLSKLSLHCRERHLPLGTAIMLYRKVTGTPRIPFPAVTALTSLANASFCRLFGGDGMAMLIVLVATACGFYVKDALHRKWHIDPRLSIIAVSCISAVMSCSARVFSWSGTPDTALATSVLYLVPGIHYMNAVSDLINGHHICAMSRFITASTTTICLSAGLYLCLLIMNINIM